ncbi:CDGSH iron-sulfur domain-containing protein [Zoogloea sp.]|uniref:CDGSH iron-sulfur domain-containing protein n=1 Tax=Zoogloea sp. TaxID=49181 RepID=UPI002C9F6F61|nr:CDGSH iron-sulfur domain-containing protein [Zoogloea sp.]HNH17814.1 CDGSH iron-sulfur domain-containing protein [Zoogloea sp.]
MHGSLPMTEPQIAQYASYTVPVEAGREYTWCACGRSATQPFCDGRHAGSGIAPKTFTPLRSGLAYLCGCKHSRRAPFCDGTHDTL